MSLTGGSFLICSLKGLVKGSIKSPQYSLIGLFSLLNLGFLLIPYFYNIYIIFYCYIKADYGNTAGLMLKYLRY